MRTGLVWNELFMWHATGKLAGSIRPGLTVQPGAAFERAETKRRFKNLLDVSGLTERLVPIAARPLARTELALIHTNDYLDRLKANSDADGGVWSMDTAYGSGSYEIAALSAGGVVEAVDTVVHGVLDNAYALVRPPGHHAVAEGGMGFCLFANAAFGALRACHYHGLERVAIVDWDVHHGNGTQRIFWESANVLTISIHQQGNYPRDSGGEAEIGGGVGTGYNMNIPLPPGCGHEAYMEAMKKIIVPALEAYRPQLIIVPCGFDAGAYDPLGRMLLHSDSYREMTQTIMVIAEGCCEGRLVMCHEGGYEENSVPYMGLAVIETLCAIRTGVCDPHLEDMKGLHGQALQPHQRAHIDRLATHFAGGPMPYHHG